MQARDIRCSSIRPGGQAGWIVRRGGEPFDPLHTLETLLDENMDLRRRVAALEKTSQPPAERAPHAPN